VEELPLGGEGKAYGRREELPQWVVLEGGGGATFQSGGNGDVARRGSKGTGPRGMMRCLIAKGEKGKERKGGRSTASGTAQRQKRRKARHFFPIHLEKKQRGFGGKRES